MCHVEAFGPVPTPPASCKVTLHLLSGASSSCTTCPSGSPCRGEGRQGKAVPLGLPGAGLSWQKGGKRNSYAMSSLNWNVPSPELPGIWWEIQSVGICWKKNWKKHGEWQPGCLARIVLGSPCPLGLLNPCSSSCQMTAPLRSQPGEWTSTPSDGLSDSLLQLSQKPCKTGKAQPKLLWAFPQRLSGFTPLHT